MSQPHRFRDANGAAYSLTTPRSMKLTPAELPLTLSADVLRLPYQPAVRIVLAEIISLHEATRGCCDCSDQHLADRLTISKDTASRAVQQLEADGLVVKVVDKGAGFYRTLTPVPAAIQAKAATNPYPERSSAYPQNAARGATRNLPPDYPQNAAPPSRNLPVDLPAKCGTNTSTINLPIEPSIKPSSASHEAAAESELVEQVAAPQAAKEELPADDPAASASHTGAAPKKPARPKPVRSHRPEVAFAESELAAYPAFEAAFAGTDYALANLRYYHEKILNWRQKGEVPRRKDWKATATQFFLHDISSNCLVLDPNTHRAESTGAGTTRTGYVSKYDR